MFCSSKRRAASTPSRTFGGLVSLLTALETATGKHSSARQPRAQEVTAVPEAGGPNPRPISRPRCLLSRVEKRCDASPLPGCGLFSGRCASNSRWEPSRPRGWAAVWLSDSRRGQQVGKACENKNGSGKQLRREESRTSCDPFKSKPSRDHQKLGFQG